MHIFKTGQFSAKRKIQLFITLVAVVFGSAHLLFPSLKIDAITMTLLVIAIVPWLEPLLKSVELPGGIKMEFQQLEKVSKEAKEVGLIKPVNDELPADDVKLPEKYAFVEIAPINQPLAIVGLRIEIEKRLRLLAEKYSVETNMPSLKYLIQSLEKADVLSEKEAKVLNDMITTFNLAAHGMEHDPRNAEWIIKNGPELLESLDSKLEVRGGRFSVGRSDEAEHWIDKSYRLCDKSTTLAWSNCIGEHSKLWETEMANIYSALSKKLTAAQLEKLAKSQESWKEYRKTDQDFILSFENLRFKIGSGGYTIIGLTFMEKIKDRTLELEEILNNFIDK